MTTFFPSWDLRRRRRCQKALVERLPGEVYSAPCSGPATGNLSADHVNVSRLQSRQSNASIFMLEYGCRLGATPPVPVGPADSAFVSRRRVNSSLLQHSSSAGSLSAPGFSISFKLSPSWRSARGANHGVIVSSYTYTHTHTRWGRVHVERKA